MIFAFYHEGSARCSAHEKLEVKALLSLPEPPSISVSLGNRRLATGPAKNVSDETRRDAGLSAPDLWLRYFGLGGMSTPAEVESYLRGGVAPSAHDHDVLAQALNERFAELGRNHPVQYAEARR